MLKYDTVIAISTYKDQTQCCHTASKEARVNSEQSKAGYSCISMTKSSAATLQEEYLNESQKYADDSFKCSHRDCQPCDVLPFCCRRQWMTE